MSDQFFSNIDQVPLELHRAALGRSLIIDHVGTHAAKKDDGSCPFPTLEVSEGVSTLVFEGHADLVLDLVPPKELLMMLPTQLIPHLSEAQQQSLVDIIKSNVVDILKVGLRGIAGTLNNESVENAQQRYASLLRNLSNMRQEGKLRGLDQSGRFNLIFFARFSAYVEAHILLNKYAGEEDCLLPESDARKALDLYNLFCQR
jgi:hypothetical protein